MIKVGLCFLYLRQSLIDMGCLIGAETHAHLQKKALLKAAQECMLLAERCRQQLKRSAKGIEIFRVVIASRRSAACAPSKRTAQPATQETNSSIASPQLNLKPSLNSQQDTYTPSDCTDCLRAWALTSVIVCSASLIVCSASFTGLCSALTS